MGVAGGKEGHLTYEERGYVWFSVGWRFPKPEAYYRI